MYTADTLEGRLEIYEFLLSEWSKPVSYYTINGLCHTLNTDERTRHIRVNQLKEVECRKWVQWGYYWSGSGGTSLGRKIRIDVLKSAIIEVKEALGINS